MAFSPVMRDIRSPANPYIFGPDDILHECSQCCRAPWPSRQMCGKTPGEIDDETGRKVRLHLGHIVDRSLGGRDELSNLRTLCSTCNQGAKNITHEKPSGIWLLSQIRRATADDQRAAYRWLAKKYGDA